MKLMIIILLQTVLVVFGSLITRDVASNSKKWNKRKGRNSRNEREGNNSNGNDNKSEEKWVVDSIFYDDYQSDAPMDPPESLDVCSPVPDVVSKDACAKTKCQQDIDCTDKYRCCFNGCVYTCLHEIAPAPVVDWRKEPRRSNTGVSWLIPDQSSSSTEVEMCSTSPVDVDEDPLLCPNGHFCHVTDHGDPENGIPNSGYCVKESENTYSPGEEDLVLKSALRQRQVCKVDHMILLEGASILLKDKSCRCRKGLLSCKNRSRKVRAKKKSKTDKEKRKEKKRKRRKSKKRNTSS